MAWFRYGLYVQNLKVIICADVVVVLLFTFGQQRTHKSQTLQVFIYCCLTKHI